MNTDKKIMKTKNSKKLSATNIQRSMSNSDLESDCRALANAARKLDKNNWQDKVAAAAFQTLRQKTMKRVAAMLNGLAKQSLVDCTAFHKKSFVTFRAVTVCENGGVQINCQLDAAECSSPPPPFNIPGMESAVTVDKNGVQS